MTSGDPTARGRVGDQAVHQVRALVFHEEEWWVAQCLEYDLATQARTLKDLVYELEKLLIGQLVAADQTGRIPFANLADAPRRFFDLWEEAMDVSPRGADEPHLGMVKPPEVRYRLADVA